MTLLCFILDVFFDACLYFTSCIFFFFKCKINQIKKCRDRGNHMALRDIIALFLAFYQDYVVPKTKT